MYFTVMWENLNVESLIGYFCLEKVTQVIDILVIPKGIHYKRQTNELNIGQQQFNSH